jgi:hypothetical protein
MTLASMSIRSRLFATLAVLSGVLMLVGFSGFAGTRTANEGVHIIFEGRLLPSAWTHEIGDEVQPAQIEAAERDWEISQGKFKAQLLLILAASVTGIVVSGVLGMALVRSIVSALRTAIGVADQIANGQLDSARQEF